MLIGLSGKTGTGKSVLTRHLCAKLQAVKFSFGDLLKEECSDYFGFDLNLCYTQKGKESIITKTDVGPGFVSTVRGALQWYGTDYRRKKDPYYWVNALRGKIKNSLLTGIHVIIDDVRFFNEAGMIIDENGVLIRLNPYEGWKPGTHSKHLSEVALDAWIDWDICLTPEYGKLELAANIIVDKLRTKGIL